MRHAKQSALQRNHVDKFFLYFFHNSHDKMDFGKKLTINDNIHQIIILWYSKLLEKMIPTYLCNTSLQFFDESRTR